MANVECAAEKVRRICKEIARFSESVNGTTRPFLCTAAHECHRYLIVWMESLGMEATVDAAGNLRGFYPGVDNTRRLVIGSHLDTVPNAGAYDGILGVVLGIALVETLKGRRLSFGIEVVGFSEEEGVRFSLPFIGSRAFTGTLTEDVLLKQDWAGITVKEAIRNFGQDPSRIGESLLCPGTFAYLEFHIEQGPVLESLGQPLGIVEAIAGQTRAFLTFTGKANHAGTTPMHLRHDALTAAAEWISFVESYARSTSELVATVGQIEALPGAGNVIPGEVRVSLDVRHAIDTVRESAVLNIFDKAKEIASKRGVAAIPDVRLSQPAVAMDETLVERAQKALSAAGYSAPRMVSGAGHDAMIVAGKVPSVMIFLRSPGGVSHHPDESVLVQDVHAALHAGHAFLESLSA